MNTDPEAAGLAALSICESLLLSLSDNEVLGNAEIVSILADAAAAHRGAMAGATDPRRHAAAAEVIDRIIKGKNSVGHI